VAEPVEASSTGPTPGEIVVRVETRIRGIPCAAWDGLEHGPSPFLRHGFLAALEDTGSTGGRSGWQPVYLLAERDGALLGAVAAFIKHHSYGEYIFDWGWASAAGRAGLDYYPKLVIAAPMTPATGNRILLAPGADPELITRVLAAATRAIAKDAECSSIHWLFCTADEQRRLAALGFAPRASYQFHWHNRGYATWDDFLGGLKSRKRKQLRKERERARAAIDSLDWIEGGALATAQLDDLDRFYRTTTDQHGGRDYLRPGFFHRLAETCPDTLRMVEVKAGGARIAGAVFFETPSGLYGRYWGATAHVDLLHFETAYYAGIDRCIARGLPLFEAGAQGEHKLLRGFEPTATYSAHWIAHPAMRAAIEDFCAREAHAVGAQIEEMKSYLPYRGPTDDDA
jgi:predicted N-acyltransferase